ncbi:MAG: ADP-ribosylglycohydrolase family protein, partial [Cyanobacteria bacterium P01_F01_bin.153]
QRGNLDVWRHPNFTFGQYTDDTQLMREMLISLVACEGLSPDDYGRRIGRLYANDTIVGSSRAGREVAKRINGGTPWKESGTPAPYASNGSSMRAAPIGLFFAKDPEKLIQAACEQGYITHQDPRASAGAVAIASAVAIAIQSQEIAPVRFLEELKPLVQRVDGSFREALDHLSNAIDLPLDAAREKIARMGNLPPRYDSWEGISPWVIPSVLWSLYSFLQSPHDYWKTICTAIAGGGDTDTTAAMAGAVSGAFLGLDAVPTRVSHQLTDQGKWEYLQLLALADLGFYVASNNGFIL